MTEQLSYAATRPLHCSQLCCLSLQVKVRRNYPLTSLEDIVYTDDEPLAFHLLFQKYEMILEADNEAEAKSWADAIRNGETVSCDVVPILEAILRIFKLHSVALSHAVFRLNILVVKVKSGIIILFHALPHIHSLVKMEY